LKLFKDEEIVHHGCEHNSQKEFSHEHDTNKSNSKTV